MKQRHKHRARLMVATLRERRAARVVTARLTGEGPRMIDNLAGVRSVAAKLWAASVAAEARKSIWNLTGSGAVMMGGAT